MNNDFGHGGGDYFLVKDIIDFYHSGGAVLTSIDKAMASHFIGFAAEESRLEHGKLIEVNK